MNLHGSRDPRASRPGARGFAPERTKSVRLTAVLGPTNTGKTYLAIERMLAHRSGMIGLPLRLLAREVYDKIVRLVGPADAALITGEERIVPPHPRFYVCTVEAMPVDIEVAFLAIDEIQLCADPERGHIFTDRLLHARGSEETMLLGAATMRSAIQRMVPHAVFVTRPRFSDLTYTGAKKLTRLPRRSAVVAFSAQDVYGLADLVRSQRGGAAVVMGALSPRTRNAQVALYQSGDADFMIATDAIGMGINMDVDHVAFASLDKFDGVTIRPLRPDELGQIAGRAGRYMNDGTFGVTAEAEPLDGELVAQIEAHRYEPVRVLQWRNSVLDFSTISALLASLEAPPPQRGLVRSRIASDHLTLRMLSQDADVAAGVKTPPSVKLLWDACQLPDFRKLTPDEHARLVTQIFLHLQNDGALPEDWLARQIARLDVVDGDVDTLSGRLAQIRTWTYAAHRSRWTRDPSHWQEMTRAVEDRLSDALHERLTQRFIDRRTSVLMRHLRDDDYMTIAVDGTGSVTIGEEYAGKLVGFRFAPDPRAEGIHGRTLRAAALRGLQAEIAARARALIEANDGEIHLSEHGQLWWRDAPVARLVRGAQPLSPAVALIADELLSAETHGPLRRRLEDWVTARIATRLEPLVALRRAVESPSETEGAPSGLARGLAFRLVEDLGQIDRKSLAPAQEISDAVAWLRRFGVRLGRQALYLPRLLKPEPSGLIALLWAVHQRLEPVPAPPAPGLTSFIPDETTPPAFLAAAFYHPVGSRAVRLDIIERVHTTIARASSEKEDAGIVIGRISSLLGSSSNEAAEIVEALGWRRVPLVGSDDKKEIWLPKRGKRGKGKTRPGQRNAAPKDSPFAELAALLEEN